MPKPLNHDDLRERLDALVEVFDAREHRDNDPISLVWEYSDPADQELVALLASGVAYGRVALVRDAGRRAATPLGPAPASTLLGLSDDDLTDIYDGYVYRMTRGADVADLLAGCRDLIATHGSLHASYAAQSGSDHVERASNWVKAIRAGRIRPELERGLRYLLPDPGDGGACKRLHLFFRWVARGPDEIDLGIWPTPAANELLMPLDTHTARMCRYIGLSVRKTTNGIAAKEVADALRLLDPDDPLRFDFPLCHLGISGSCIHVRSDAHCPSCPLDPICTLE